MLESFHKFDLLAERLLLVVSALALLLHQLTVAALLLLLGFHLLQITAFLLSHAKQLDVLLLELVVNFVFFLVGRLASPLLN
jgi:hypothetical protein